MAPRDLLQEGEREKNAYVEIALRYLKLPRFDVLTIEETERKRDGHARAMEIVVDRCTDVVHR